MEMEPEIDLRGEDGELIATIEFTESEFHMIVEAALQPFVINAIMAACDMIQESIKEPKRVFTMGWPDGTTTSQEIDDETYQAIVKNALQFYANHLFQKAIDEAHKTLGIKPKIDVDDSEVDIQDSISEIDVESEIDVKFGLRYEVLCANCCSNVSGKPAYTHPSYAEADIAKVFTMRNYKCCDDADFFVWPFSAPIANLSRK